MMKTRDEQQPVLYQSHGCEQLLSRGVAVSNMPSAAAVSSVRMPTDMPRDSLITDAGVHENIRQ